MLRRECLIDWFQFTLPYSEENENEAFRFIGAYSPLKPTYALHGYGFAQKNEFGAIAMTNRKRPEMGVHVQLPGQQCQIMRDMGESFEGLSKDILAASGKGSRIDLTSDFQPKGLRPRALMAKFEEKKVKGTARKASIIYELEGGETLYVGSWKSSRFSRIYEKTRNFGNIDEQILRMELISKDRYAHAALIEVAENGVTAGCNAALSSLNKMCEFELDVWKEMMSEKSNPMTIGRKSTADDDSWLMNIVASAVAKRIARIDGSEFWARFERRVQEKLQQISRNTINQGNDHENT